MKKFLFPLMVATIFLVGEVFADQVIAKFETGTDGYAIVSWTAAISAISSVNDPDATQSDKALKLDFNGASGDRGLINLEAGVNVGNALIITYWVWLPTDIPDSIGIEFYAQDFNDWTWVQVDVLAKNIPKGVWYPVSFNLKELAIKSAGFDPYAGKLNACGFGLQRWGETDADANWAGSIYIDDVSLVGGYPTVIGDFETGVGSFANTGWGSGYVDMASVADPATGATDKALRVGFNGANGGSARIFWENGLTPAATDLALMCYVYVPTGTPDSISVTLVAQDNNWAHDTEMGIMTGNIPKDTWYPLVYDYAALTSDPTIGFAKGTLRWVGIEIDRWSESDADANWAGNIYFDDLMFVGTNEALPPLVASTLTVEAMAKPDKQGKYHHYNYITYTEQPEHTQAKYYIYFSENPITDNPYTNSVAGTHLLQTLTASGKSSTSFGHELFSADGTGTKTYYYAVVVVEDSTKFDPTNSTGVATNGCTDAVDIPLLQSFNFSADGDLSEFEAVAQQFPGMVILPQSQGGGDDPDFVYTPGNTTFDFRGYCVMTSQAMYWGFYVTDATYGNSQLWRGDGVDPFFGLYDINANEEILGSMDYGKGWMRFGVAAREATENKLQWNGYDTAFDLPVTVAAAPAGFETNDYIVEWSFRFDSLANYTYNNAQGPNFTPVDGMFIPFKIDVNDNDTTFDAIKGSESRKHQLSHGATFESAGWPNPFGWAGRAVITTVPKTGVKEFTAVPSKYELAQAYPNPFNPTTNISYKVAQVGQVNLVIYDILGREVRTLVNQELTPGEYQITWDGKDNRGRTVGSGIYFCQMKAGDFCKIQKVTLMK